MARGLDLTGYYTAMENRNKALEETGANIGYALGTGLQAVRDKRKERHAQGKNAGLLGLGLPSFFFGQSQKKFDAPMSREDYSMKFGTLDEETGSITPKKDGYEEYLKENYGGNWQTDPDTGETYREEGAKEGFFGTYGLFGDKNLKDDKPMSWGASEEERRGGKKGMLEFLQKPITGSAVEDFAKEKGMDLGDSPNLQHWLGSSVEGQKLLKEAGFSPTQTASILAGKANLTQGDLLKIKSGLESHIKYGEDAKKVAKFNQDRFGLSGPPDTTDDFNEEGVELEEVGKQDDSMLDKAIRQNQIIKARAEFDKAASDTSGAEYDPSTDYGTGESVALSPIQKGTRKLGGLLSKVGGKISGKGNLSMPQQQALRISDKADVNSPDYVKNLSFELSKQSKPNALRTIQFLAEEGRLTNQQIEELSAKYPEAMNFYMHTEQSVDYGKSALGEYTDEGKPIQYATPPGYKYGGR